jgi:hypothetical protein
MGTSSVAVVVVMAPPWVAVVVMVLLDHLVVKV